MRPVQPAVVDTADVIIIGGGVIGLTVADRLAADERRVVLLDKGVCGSEASWAGAGLLAPCSWHRRDELARMHRDAILRYESFAADVGERSGIDPQYRRCGALRLIHDDHRLQMARREVEAAAAQAAAGGEPAIQTLSVTEALRLEPNLTADLLGAQHCRRTAQIRNPRLLAGLRAAAQRRGVCIREHTPAHGLIKAAGAVSGVQTDQGPIFAAVTVLCAGAWSAQVDEELARAVPVYPVRGQIILLHAQPAPLRRIIQDGKFYIVPRDDGHVLIGATEEHDAGFSLRSTAAGVAGLAERAVQLMPALAGAAVVRTWAGLRPAAPDRRPIIGPVPGLRGLLACTGHFRIGLTLAPVAGEVIADLVDHGGCAYDLASCRPGRF